jgi:very-short-patch-repair endonuclease
LSEKGFRVVRFWNEEVLREMDRVLMMIKWMLPPRPAAPQ